MKTILILGSTSPIGAALSEQFSKGNRIILSGRNQSRLSEVAGKCTKSGAIVVNIVPADLSKSIQAILNVNSEYPIEIIIDAASSASTHRDTSLKLNTMVDTIQADLLSHLHIYQELTQLNNKSPDIIFISTILAIIKTPDREVYSALKRMVEIYLQIIIAAQPETRILIFRIGKLIDSKRDSLAAISLAERVKHDFLAGHNLVNYGFSGKLLTYLNAIHPTVLNFFIETLRRVRNT